MSEMNPLVNEQEEKIRIQTQKGELEMSKQVEDHLRSLEGYGEGLYPYQNDQKREENTKQILEMQDQVMERYYRLHPTAVRRTAQGRPVQRIRPAKVSWKERRKRARETNEVRTVHGLTNCDYRTLRAVNALKQEDEEVSNSYTKKVEDDIRNDKCHIQHRMAHELTKPVRLDTNGNPLTEEDRKNKKYNTKMYAAFKQVDFSQEGDAAQKKAIQPYFDRIIDELYYYNFTPQKNTDDYILSHATEMKRITLRLNELADMYKSLPFFKSFFDELGHREAEKKIYIDSLIKNGAGIIGTISARFAACGVKLNESEYEFQEGVEENATLLETFEQQHAYENASKALKEGRNKALDEFTVEYGYDELASKLKFKEDMKERTGIDFTGYVTEYSYEVMTDVKRWIAENPDEYETNRGLVDRQYQKLYRALDSMGDIQHRINTMKRVADQIAGSYPNNNSSLFTIEDRSNYENLTERAQELETGDLATIKEHITGIQDYLKHLLEGVELTEGGRLYSEQDLEEQEKERKKNSGHGRREPIIVDRADLDWDDD